MPAFGPVGQKLVLGALTLWALAMVVPDLYRPFHPLGSFGLYADNDGVVTDTRGPFADDAASPAWQAGIRSGDRLDLQRMRCIPLDTLRCATAEAVLGGLLLVSDRRQAELVLEASGEQPARTVSLIAGERPFSWTVTLVLLLDQVAAIAVVLAAAWLVWTRPGVMTWAFFLYVIWFNPGQSYVFYALLQHAPLALMAQNLIGTFAQGVGLAGLLVFAVRVPNDRNSDRWRPLLRAMPVLAVMLGLLNATSFLNLFGYPTETLTRAGVTSGFIAAAAAFAILLARRGELAPAEYQRLRWITWGCLIGLPALSLADLGQQTALLPDILGTGPPTDIAWDLLRLVNGVLCLFVFEAVRKPRVVNVSIPLRRVTLLGLTLSAPALLLHQQMDHVREQISEDLTLPAWLWLGIATGVLFAISRLHESAVHLADHHFNRHLRRVEARLGEAILLAQDAASVDGVLSTRTCDALGLASATLFRNAGSGFLPCVHGWETADRAPSAIEPDADMLKRLDARRPFDIGPEMARRYGLAGASVRPVLAVPVATGFKHYAIAFYGEHLSGTAFSHDERALMTELATRAAEAYTKLELRSLQQRIAELEQCVGLASAENPRAGLSSAG